MNVIKIIQKFASFFLHIPPIATGIISCSVFSTLIQEPFQHMLVFLESHCKHIIFLLLFSIVLSFSYFLGDFFFNFILQILCGWNQIWIHRRPCLFTGWSFSRARCAGFGFLSSLWDVVVFVSFVLQFSSVTSDYFSISFSLCQSC